MNVKVSRVAVLIFTLAVLLAIAPVAGAQVAPAAAPAAPRAPLAGWAPFTPTIPMNAAINAVAMVSAGDVWAVGDAGTVYHYNGSVWAQLTSSTTQNINSVSPIPGSAGEAYAVGDGAGGITPSTVLLCNAATASCSQVPGVPTTGGLDSVWATSVNDVWVVGVQIILHYKGGGAWDSVLTPGVGTLPMVQYHNVQIVSATDGWAVGELGTILHYSGGLNWSQVTPNVSTTDSLIGLWFQPTGEGLAVGGNRAGGVAATVLHHTGTAPNTGWTIEPVTMDQPSLFWYVTMASNGMAWAVANGSQVYQRAPGGGWTLAYRPPGTGNPTFWGVWVLPDASEGWAVGGNTSGVLVHYTGGAPVPICGAGINCPLKTYLPFVRR